MTLDELIEELQTIREAHSGNMLVKVQDSCFVELPNIVEAEQVYLTSLCGGKGCLQVVITNEDCVNE